MNRVEDHLLGLAVETEYALYETVWSLWGEYPESSEGDLVALARPAMRRLLADGLIEMYWHSSRDPASPEEDQQVRAELERRLRKLGSAQSVTGPVGVPVETSMTQAQIQEALGDDAWWRPPEGAAGRPWFETPHVYFLATDHGKRTHRERRPADEAQIDQAEGESVPGPPFRVGERVAFFPTVIGPTSNWLRFEDAIIDKISTKAESFDFHFVSEPEPKTRHAQGLENIVRRSAAYEVWRSAWEAAFARTGDEQTADRETEKLRVKVLAEHPIHGIDVQRFQRRSGEQSSSGGAARNERLRKRSRGS
jgi:hypothetical protein